MRKIVTCIFNRCYPYNYSLFLASLILTCEKIIKQLKNSFNLCGYLSAMHKKSCYFLSLLRNSLIFIRVNRQKYIFSKTYLSSIFNRINELLIFSCLFEQSKDGDRKMASSQNAEVIVSPSLIRLARLPNR